jgi:putative DNA-binding protein
VLAERQRRFANELPAVHRETTLAALTHALESIYPSCLRIVGPEFFRAMARRFAGEVPSTSPDLNDYGESFAEWLAIFPPARELPYLPDVARLDWALHRARHAPAGVPARVIRSPYPIDRIVTMGDDEVVSLEEGGAELAVARDATGTRFTLLRRI